jgi:hypothetical protein
MTAVLPSSELGMSFLPLAECDLLHGSLGFLTAAVEGLQSQRMAAVCSITKSVAEFPKVGKVGVVAFETDTLSAVLHLPRSMAPLSTNNFPHLSRKIIMFRTIRMESFEIH